MDAQIMPDSLVGAASATPSTGLTPEPVGTVAGSPEGNQPAPEDKRLADNQEAVKEAQRQYHELKGQIAQMNQQINTPVAEKPAEDFLNSESFLKKFDDDPATAAREAILSERERLADAWGGVLETQRKDMLEQFQSMLAISPEKQTHTAELTELATSIPGFDALPDETRVQMAKVLRTAKGEEALTPPGSPAGSGYTEAQRTTAEDERKKNIEALTASWFGPEAVKNSELYPGVTGHGSLQPTGV
tara:strand:- start:700 stop:1437 length:738 start_codon:yes stop_codon:yes gene_type:complete